MVQENRNSAALTVPGEALLKGYRAATPCWIMELDSGGILH